MGDPKSPQEKRKGSKDPGHDSSAVNTTQHDKVSAEEKAPWKNADYVPADPFRHSES